MISQIFAECGTGTLELSFKFFLYAGSDSSYNKCGSIVPLAEREKKLYLNMPAVEIHVGLRLTVRPVGVFPNRTPFQSSFSPIENSMFLMYMVCTVLNYLSLQKITTVSLHV
jgi:hypothetical protein